MYVQSLVIGRNDVNLPGSFIISFLNGVVTWFCSHVLFLMAAIQFSLLMIVNAASLYQNQSVNKKHALKSNKKHNKQYCFTLCFIIMKGQRVCNRAQTCDLKQTIHNGGQHRKSIFTTKFFDEILWIWTSIKQSTFLKMAI